MRGELYYIDIIIIVIIIIMIIIIIIIIYDVSFFPLYLWLQFYLELPPLPWFDPSTLG